MNPFQTFLIATAVAGCSAATSPSSRHAATAPSRDAVVPLPSPSFATAEVNPTAVVGLQDAIALALLQNPELAEYSAQLRANEARVVQAGVRPNPEALVYVEDVLGTGRFRGGREAQLTLQLSQAIELGSKRAARVATATRAQDVATREYEAKRVDVLAQVTRHFIDVLAAQHAVALAETRRQLAQSTVEATIRQARAGAGSALDQRKATIERARLRMAAEHAEHELSGSRRQLAAVWGSGVAQFERVEGDLFSRHALPTYQQLTDRLTQAPDMLRQLSERDLREAEVRLADTKRIPSPILMAGVRHLEGPEDEAFLFGVQVPLPASDRNQGGRAEARALLAKSDEIRRATELRLRTVLFGLHQELRHASVALDALENDIVPQAEQSLSLSRDGFAQGRFSYLELADAERTLAAVKSERVETAANYHRLVLEIERLTGVPIDGGDEGRAVRP
jgi:cobalt-zinc-cadmium efflux system outer membrane protein